MQKWKQFKCVTNSFLQYLFWMLNADIKFKNLKK